MDERRLEQAECASSCEVYPNASTKPGIAMLFLLAIKSENPLVVLLSKLGTSFISGDTRHSRHYGRGTSSGPL